MHLVGFYYKNISRCTILHIFICYLYQFQPVTHTLNITFSNCKASICKVCLTYQNMVKIKIPMLFKGAFDRIQVVYLFLLLVIIYIYIFLISCHKTWPNFVPTFSYRKYSNTCKISGFITRDYDNLCIFRCDAYFSMDVPKI